MAAELAWAQNGLAFSSRAHELISFILAFIVCFQDLGMGKINVGTIKIRRKKLGSLLSLPSSPPLSLVDCTDLEIKGRMNPLHSMLAHEGEGKLEVLAAWMEKQIPSHK